MDRQQWLKNRRIGGSDAAAIMGVSPWDTPYSKWLKIMTGQQTPDNPYMQYGRAMEEPTRKILEKRTGMLFVPINIESKKWEFMTASLDGFDEDNKIIGEIKNPWSEKDHLIAKSGKVPEKYFPQCQHYLECEERAEKLLYSSFFVKDKNKPIELLTEDDIDAVFLDVHRDEKYLKKLIPTESNFWDLIITQTPPNKTLKDEPYFDPDEAMIQKQLEVLKAKALKEQWEEAEENLKKELIALAQGRNIKFYDGYTLKQTLPKGPVQYDLIPELQGVNKDLYRKEPTLRWTLNSPRGKSQSRQ